MRILNKRGKINNYSNNNSYRFWISVFRAGYHNRFVWNTAINQSKIAYRSAVHCWGETWFALACESTRCVDSFCGCEVALTWGAFVDIWIIKNVHLSLKFRNCCTMFLKLRLITNLRMWEHFQIVARYRIGLYLILIVCNLGCIEL